MIGTTLKLGFDGTAVSRGLGRVSRGLGAFGKQFAIGAMQRVGHRMTDLMGRLVMAVPQALKETADWASNMTDMATQTGVSVEKLVLLEEKLRLAGASARDTSRIISTLAASLQEARDTGGAPYEALQRLGFTGFDFKDMPIDQAFDEIGRRVASVGGDIDGLEKSMEDLFGARIGFGLLRFYKDMEVNTDRAKKNVADFARSMERVAPRLDTFADSLGRWENFKRGLSSIAMDEMFRLTGGEGFANNLFDRLNPEKLRPKISEFFNLVGRNLEAFLSQDLSKSFGDLFRNIGRSIGDGIRDSIGDMFSIKNLNPFKFPWTGGKTSATDAGKNAVSELESQTALLRDIKKEAFVSRFS